MGRDSLVEDVEDLLDHLLPHGGQAAAHSTQELVVAHAARVIAVKVAVQDLDVLRRQAQIVQSAALLELLDVQLPVPVHVANLPGSKHGAHW